MAAGAVQPTTWHGLEAWTLASEALVVTVVPQLGAKIVSLLDKRNGVEWLAGPGTRAVRPLEYGAAFERQDMSGWDEMFPTISACPYPGPGPAHGVALPDHGEVWALPWTVEEASAGAQHMSIYSDLRPRDTGCLRLSVRGRALAYRLARTASLPEPDMLMLHYELANLGNDPMPYIWAAHPQFAAEGAQVVLPPEVTEVCNVLPPAWGWGAPETQYSWPQATGIDGQLHRLDEIGGPERQQARKFYVLPEQRIATAMLVRQPDGPWLRLTWRADDAPYFGLWIDEGALHHQAVAAPEPATGFYDSLALAWEKQQMNVVEPGQSTTWVITVEVGGESI